MPPTLPKNPLSYQELDSEYVSDYKINYKDYIYNAYINKRHIYNFTVDIRPATWIEAVNYNAFPLGDYLAITIVFLIIVNVYFTFYYFAHKGFFRNLFTLKYNINPENKIEKMNFFESYKLSRNPIVTFVQIIKNNIVANLVVSFPILILIGIYFEFFTLSGIFQRIPSKYTNQNDDYSDTVASASAFRINNLARLGSAIISLGFFLLYLGSQAVRPDYHPDIIKRNLVNAMQKMEKSISRINITTVILGVTFFLLILTFQFSSIFSKSQTGEIVLIVLFQTVISTFIYNLFEKQDNLLLFIVNTLLNITDYNLILSCKEVNIMLLMLITNQFSKYLKIMNYEKINRLVKKLLDATVFRKSAKEKLYEKVLEDDNDNGKKGEEVNEQDWHILNSNITVLSAISSDISINLVVIPIIYFNILVMQYAMNSSESDIFKITTIFTLICVTLLLNMFNYYIMMSTNHTRDGKISLNIRLLQYAFYIYRI